MTPTSPASIFAKRFRLFGFLVLAAALGLAGCAQIGDMGIQPRYDYLEESPLFADSRSARPLVEGSVPQTETQFGDPAVSGVDENGDPFSGLPVEATAELVARGQERFEIYCTVCHGEDAQGNGQAVAFGFPNPPSLLDQAAQDLTSGEIFAIIDNGKGVMYPYGYRVKPTDRWAIIAYLRGLQLKGGLFTDELTADELRQIGSWP